MDLLRTEDEKLNGMEQRCWCPNVGFLSEDSFLRDIDGISWSEPELLVFRFGTVVSDDLAVSGEIHFVHAAKIVGSSGRLNRLP